jgi:predicted nucleic acid-binding protein
MYLIDTCIFFELIKKKPSPLVTRWILDREEVLFFVSVLTFGEIKKGIEKLPNHQRRKKLKAWFHDFMIPRYRDRFITIDESVAIAWGDLVAKVSKTGRVLPTIDSLIAASAIVHRLTIVTRNTKDFEGLDIPLINPWEG